MPTMKTDSKRFQAYLVLFKTIQGNQPVSFIESTSALTKEIVFGVCRHYYRLQVVTQKLAPKKIKSIEVVIVIYMGLYQLWHMDKPAYAVIKETVDILSMIRCTWAKGFVNAILRRFLREKAAILAECESEGLYKYGHPLWLVKSLQEDWPVDYESILKANDTHPPMYIRVNTQKIKRDGYLAQLQATGIEAIIDDTIPQGIRLLESYDVHALPGFSDGQVSVQDKSAQMVTGLFEFAPGMRVLDACCAPGGKLCHMLECEPTLDMVGVDQEAKRLERVRENLTRLGMDATLYTADASNLDAWWDGVAFDAILLDAPCSGTGVIRRHPDIKILRTMETVASLVAIQATLLDTLWTTLKPGKRLVYATCSVLRIENDRQIQNFLGRHSDAKCVLLSNSGAYWTGYGYQLFPEDASGDGFFYAVLEKQEKR